MPAILAGLFGFLGTGVKSLFGFKQAQADVVSAGLKVLSDVTASDAQKTTAVSQIIVAEASSQYWLAACWRPLFMIVFMIIILSFWFGYSPPHLNDPMPPMVGRIFDLIEVGMGGYIGGRSLEKIFSTLFNSQVLKALINKQIL